MTTLTTSRASAVDSLAQQVSTAVEQSLAKGLILPFLIEGVEVKVYATGTRSALHADVLLDRDLWDIEDLPARGNRPRRDSGTGRAWYDLSASTTNLNEPVDSPARTRSIEDAAAALNEDLTELLTEIAVLRLRSVIASAVDGLTEGALR